MAKKLQFSIEASFDPSKVIKGVEEIQTKLNGLNFSGETTKEFQREIKAINALLPKVTKYSNKKVFNEEEANDYVDAIMKISTAFRNIRTIAGDSKVKLFPEEAEQIKQIDSQLESVENRIKEIYKISKHDSNLTNFLKNNKDDKKIKLLASNWLEYSDAVQVASESNEEIKKTSEEISGMELGKVTNNQIENLLASYNNTKAKSKVKNSDIASWLSTNGFEIKDESIKGQGKLFTGILKDLQSLSEGTDEYNAKIKELLELVTQVDEKEGIPEQIASSREELEAYRQKIEELSEIIQKLIEERNNNLGLLQKEQEANELAASKEEILNNTEERRKKLIEELKKIYYQINPGIVEFIDLIEESTEAQKEEYFQTEALSKTFSGLINKITGSFSALSIVNKQKEIIRDAIASVKELDAAFTQIGIVSGKSGEEAWKMFDSFNKLAKQYSITTIDLAEGAKLFYQQGLNSADTMKMVEASTVSAALGEVTMTQAANTLTAALQGYNETAEKAMDYTDKIAQVGAVSAADFTELSYAMEKTASSAYSAGIDFDHLMGYLGKTIEVTREAPHVA